MNKFYLTILIILPFQALTTELDEARVKHTIEKSKTHRQKVVKAQVKSKKSKRDPSSIKTTFDEFESFMNNQNDKQWLEEIDQL